MARVRSNGNRGLVVELGRNGCFGVHLGACHRLPTFERFGRDYWMLDGFGITIWSDRTAPVTVGQRGAW